MDSPRIVKLLIPVLAGLLLPLCAAGCKEGGGEEDADTDIETTGDPGADTEARSDIAPDSDAAPDPFVDPGGEACQGGICGGIDECAQGLDDCDPHAECTDTPASFECACASGYAGNGRVCYRQLAPSTAPVCGNGVVEETEQCDDGGTTDGDGCSSACRVELGTTEEHPVLFVRAADRPALLTKLGTSTISGEVGEALAAWIRGERHQPSIDFITAALAGGNGHDIYTALLLYDVQYEFMTPGERDGFRTAFLADAQTIYDEAVAVGAWYYVRRMVNNWTYRQAGAPLPRLLFSGIMLRGDPQADSFVDKGLELTRWLFEVNPNNGTWNRATQSYDAWPTQGEMNDEILATPNSYGLWAADDLSRFNFMVRHATGFDTYAHLDGAIREWGRYWTYILSFDEGINWNDMDWYSFASYAGQTGHGDFGHIGYYSNAYMLHYAHLYDEPVFAWHYCANPSPTRFNGNYEATWSAPLDWYESWLMFLDWAVIAPTSPQAAGWPLSAFWPNAGAGVIRKSWEKKGPGSGIVWLRAGPGGSHDRPMYGAVQYHADSQVLLGAAPTSYDYDFLTRDPHVNNTLFIDDMGERGYYSENLETDRLRHGHTQWIGSDTFIMDMSPGTASTSRARSSITPTTFSGPARCTTTAPSTSCGSRTPRRRATARATSSAQTG